jgi:hypothetical protein
LKLHVGRSKRTDEQMQEWAQRELSKSDTNGNGELCFEEFLSYYNAFVAKHRSQIDELYELSDDELGKGAFGVVLKGRRVDSGLHVAVKRLSKAKIAEGLELLHNEIAVWEAIDHPHLVQLLDVFEDPEHLTLITEHMRGGDLFVRLKAEQEQRFSDAVASRLGAQMVAAVAYLYAATALDAHPP